MVTKNVCLLFLMLGSAAMPATGADTLHDSAVLLWPDGAPEAKGAERGDQPGLTIHLPTKEVATGAAMVICPGGGFTKLAVDNEGIQVARWMNSFGVTAFVLRYRLLPDYRPSVALLDAQRAIRYVRHNADTFGIDPDRIGTIGFSAGGSLVIGAATNFDAGDPDASDPIERVSSRPDFVVPVYSGLKEDRVEEVTADAPPAFIALSSEDRLVPAQSAFLFYTALRDKGVQAEVHMFRRGMHGTGMAPGDPEFGQWPTLLARWLRSSGFLTSAERVAVKGKVTIDGKPLAWASVAFLPEDPNAPIAWASAMGEFSIDAAHGPVPGPHRVEVHILSNDFSSLKSGKYSMDGPVSYTKASPSATGPLTVDIAADEEIQIAIVTK